MKLNIKAFSLGCAIFASLALFLGTWWMIIIGGAEGAPTIISKIYIGYKVTAAGSFIGLVWAFFDGLICGAVFAWLYNMLAERFKQPA